MIAKIITLLVFGAQLAVASRLLVKDDTKSLADLIMEKVGRAEYQRAFDQAEPYWPIPEAS